MTDNAKTPEAKPTKQADVYLVSVPGGYKMALKRPDGDVAVSDQVYPTREACAEAFNKWAEAQKLEVDSSQ